MHPLGKAWLKIIKNMAKLIVTYFGVHILGIIFVLTFFSKDFQIYRIIHCCRKNSLFSWEQMNYSAAPKKCFWGKNSKTFFSSNFFLQKYFFFLFFLPKPYFHDLTGKCFFGNSFFLTFNKFYLTFYCLFFEFFSQVKVNIKKNLGGKKKFEIQNQRKKKKWQKKQ